MLNLQQQKHQADSQQDMSDSSHPGDGGIRASGEIGPHDLGYPACRQHYGGQIQSNVIGEQHPPGLCSGEGQVLFQHHQQQEKHHPQQEVMGMYHRESSLAVKPLNLVNSR